jgi:lysophospholipase L1-like esterase
MNSTPSRLVANLLAGKSQKLVVYGTSLTYNSALLLREALQARFGNLITVVNSGQSGRASRTGLALLDEKVIAQQPDAILIEFAVNDSHTYFHEPDALDAGIDQAESERNLETIIQRIQAALPECEIIIQTMNPAWDPADNDRKPGTNRAELEEFYEGYRRVAAQHGLRLIDNHVIWREVQEEDPDRFALYVPDGVHPTPAAIREVQVPSVLRGLGL